MKKNTLKSVADIKPLVKGYGGCCAAKRIVTDGLKVCTMIRTSPDFETDTGWRFFSGTGSEEINDESENLEIFHVNTIANYDPDIIPFLHAAIGSAFARDAHSGDLVEITGSEKSSKPNPHVGSRDEVRRFLRGELPAEESKRISEWFFDPKAEADVRALSLSVGFAADVAIAQALAVSSVDVTQVLNRIHFLAETSSLSDLTQTASVEVRAEARSVEIVEVPQIPGYTFVREIGRGGMGVVFEGIDDNLLRQVAVKVMHREIATNATARQRFLREARAAASIKSDHVVVIYQVGQASNSPFIIMEMLQGATLDDWRRKHPLTTADVIRVARELFLGLEAAHANGLVHRDVKPSNIWVEEKSGRIKLLDFGLTHGNVSEGEITRSGVIIGTPAYMAPEQCNGCLLDGRTDLYASGVTLYELVTGNSPFQRNTLLATMTALAIEEPPPISLAAPWIPEALARFITRLHSKNPNDRPANARIALDELSKLDCHS